MDIIHGHIPRMWYLVTELVFCVIFLACLVGRGGRILRLRTFNLLDRCSAFIETFIATRCLNVCECECVSSIIIYSRANHRVSIITLTTETCRPNYVGTAKKWNMGSLSALKIACVRSDMTNMKGSGCHTKGTDRASPRDNRSRWRKASFRKRQVKPSQYETNVVKELGGKAASKSSTDVDTQTVDKQLLVQVAVHVTIIFQSCIE